MSIEPQVFADGSRRYVDDQTANTVGYMDGTSRMAVKKVGSITRTTTTDTTLFTIPGNAVPTKLNIFGSAASNAGTTATINVGLNSTSAYFLSGFDVKTTTSGAGQVLPNAATNLQASVGSTVSPQVPVTGKYAETGTASTSGGPWYVELEYYVP